MATSSSLDNQRSASLQKQAIEKARSSFSRLPRENAIFQQCLDQANTIPDVINSLIQNSRSHKVKKSTRLLEKFEQYSQFLQNASDVIDVVVQTQAEIGCPLWAPIKFVLMVSKNHAQAAEQVLNLIELISENHPRFEIYGKLPPDPILHIALLNIFTDVVEFSVRAFLFFKRNAIVRMIRLLVHPFKEEFGDIFDRIKRRTEVVDLTALATHLLHAAKSQQEAQKFRLQSSLQPPNVKDFHQAQVHAKLPGTCEWIREHPSFVKWNGPSPLSAPSRLLCISGTHGCGKTILASSIIEDLKSKQLQTMFFYFSGRREGLKNLTDLVRSFLWQLSEDPTDQQSLETISNLLSKGPPAVSEMVRVLNEIAALVTKPTYCVIDGADEYIDESHDSIEKLLQLVIGLLNANINFRVVLLGRQHVLQPHVLQETIGAVPENIEISLDIVKQDISAFIGAEIDAKINSDLLRLPGLRDLISETLQEKSDGMFLWAQLMINGLGKSGSQFEVKERLRNTPRGLVGIYRDLFLRLVKRLDKVQLDFARNILAFTIVSFRTLEINELQYAHALGSGPFAFKDCLLLHPARSILDVCGDFINIKDGLVQLIHFSVQEFLTRPEDDWKCSDDRDIVCFRVDFESSHRLLGFACIDYLEVCEYGYPLTDTNTFIQLAKDYPFIRYASRYIISHLGQVGSPCPATARKFRDFLRSEKYTFWIEYLFILALENGSLDVLDVLDDDIERFMTGLDMGEYKRRILQSDHRTRLDQELKRRQQLFGENDSRTEQWELLLPVIGNDLQNEDEDEETHHRPTERVRRLPLSNELSLSRISNTLAHNPILPLHRQVDMFLRINSYIQRVKIPTDPLKMLFRIIIQKSHAIPVYMLLGIGNFYYGLEKWEEALEVYRIVFAKVNTQETSFKYTILHDIGFVLGKQKKWEEAEATSRQCLEWQERVLGKENRHTISSVYHLAWVLEEQEQHAEAEILFRQALKGRMNTLGSEHEDLVNIINFLAQTLLHQRKYSEAEVLYRRSFELGENFLGKEHNETSCAASGLGASLKSQGRNQEAEAFYQRTLEIDEKTLGKEHKDTVYTAFWLAEVLSEQGKYAEAEVLYRRVLKVEENTLGKEHEDTRWTTYALAEVLNKQEKYMEAEAFYLQVLKAEENILGKEHENSRLTANRLAVVLREQEKYTEAERFEREFGLDLEEE